MNTRQTIFMAISAIVATSLCGCSDKKANAETGVVRVKTATFGGGAGVERRYSGTVEEDNATSLSFSVMGTVKTVAVEVGQAVRRGQLIATLDASSLKSSHDAALSTLRRAQDAHDRMKQLHDNGSLPDIKWVEVESSLSQAKAMEKIARKNLTDTRLIAPASGTVSEKSVEVGQNVIPGQTVAKIASTGTLKVSIAVPEGDISQIRRGQEMAITVDALGNREFRGRVDEIGVVADPLSHTYVVKLRIAGTDAALKPGMVAKVVGKAGDAAEAMTLPANIVQIDEANRTFVWIANGDKASKRYVTTADYTPGGVTVTGGITPSDKVIVEGQSKVCEGTRVEN